MQQWYPVLPCPIIHVTMDRHLRGITRGWAPSKSTYSGKSNRATRGYQANYDREDRRHEWDEDASRGSTQTRWYNPRHRLLQMSRLWTNATRTREWLLRTMPQAVEQIRPPVGDAATEMDAIIRRLGRTPSSVE